GDLDDLGLLAGHAGGEEFERAAFLDDEVEAQGVGGFEDRGFLRLVVEAVRAARGGGHEHKAEPIGRRRGRRGGLADAADGAESEAGLQRPEFAIAGQNLPRGVEEGQRELLLATLPAHDELDYKRPAGG